MKYHHDTPFGAAVQDDGSVRFAIWAPGKQAGHVKMLSPDGDIPVPMERDEHGWFTLTTRQAGPGTLYFYDFGDGVNYPDPASRRQPQGVHGPSEVIDAQAYEWDDEGWRGRQWTEAVIYELHIGTFSPEGTFAGVVSRLDHLVNLGVTAIELMPVAQGPGLRGWGYDGVYMYAPDAAYGTPEQLKHLVEAAHKRGLMVFLDVVYNHFGPDGNYLGAYAPSFFTARHKTPWGEAINFDQADSAFVRQFYWHNALYWLEEYRFDGLRCDAVHTIVDDSPTHIFEEIAIRAGDLARRQDRHIHMIAENENNASHLLERDEMGRPKRFTAQWNDDFHHCMHVLLTGQTDTYYVDYADHPAELLARCLSEGFAFQGEPSKLRGGRTRGEPSRDIPMRAFINFLQNHDQAGNRPMGDRLLELTNQAAMKAGIAVLLLNPSPPMIFMGEEWGSLQKFPYFGDFNPELAKIVREARIKDFAVGDAFKSEEAQARIPDPTVPDTMEMAKLDWNHISQPQHRAWLEYWSELIHVRMTKIVPLLNDIAEPNGEAKVNGRVLQVSWPLSNGSRLVMHANLTDGAGQTVEPRGDGEVIYGTGVGRNGGNELPPWSVIVEQV
jgi:malto-oligosyltrehalose trehalohydrolase